MNKTNNNSILSVSSKYIRDCSNISLLLQKNGIIAEVTPNQTIEKEENRYIINCGCKIVFKNNAPIEIVENIWPKLNDIFFLDKGDFYTQDGFSGDITEFIEWNTNLA